MDGPELLRLLTAVQTHEISPRVAADRLAEHTSQLGFARLDRLRGVRCGFPEVVLGAGKSFDHLLAIVQQQSREPGPILVTRVDPPVGVALANSVSGLVHSPEARAVYRMPPTRTQEGLIGILAAGTSDSVVLEEAALTAELFGARVERVLDVGIAGLHRLGDAVPLLRSANVLVVVAGMEGALPGLVAGLTDRPVIGVPSSVGYGVGQGGLAAMHTMLAACAPGLTVVNVDNGFGGGYAAALINRRVVRGASDPAATA